MIYETKVIGDRCNSRDGTAASTGPEGVPLRRAAFAVVDIVATHGKTDTAGEGAEINSPRQKE
jgi:hypothetical protein